MALVNPTLRRLFVRSASPRLPAPSRRLCPVGDVDACRLQPALLLAHFIIEKPRWQWYLGYAVSIYAVIGVAQGAPNS